MASFSTSTVTAMKLLSSVFAGSSQTLDNRVNEQYNSEVVFRGIRHAGIVFRQAHRVLCRGASASFFLFLWGV